MTRTVITPIVVPESVRRKAGLRRGEKIEFRVSGRAITIVPKPVAQSDDIPTPSRAKRLRRAETQLNAGLSQSLKEYRQGKVTGPFETAEEFIADLHRETAKPGAKKTVKRVR